MAKIKLLITDFDGTLVDESFTPSAKVRKAIKRLTQANCFVSIATGRPFQGVVQKVCADLNLTSFQIVKGGVEIIDPKKEKIIWVQYIKKQDAKKIITQLFHNKYFFSAESDDRVYTPFGRVIKEYGSGIKFEDLKKLNYEKVAKIVLMGLSWERGNKVKSVEKTAQELKKSFPNLHIVIAGLKNKPVLDITAKSANKYFGVLKLAEILKIDTKFIAGVGDNYNDIPLLKACGFKVAMENGPDKLKKMADLIIPTVEDEGLVNLVDKLVGN